MGPAEKLRHRKALLKAIGLTDLLLMVRQVDEFQELDDGLLYAWTAYKQAVVHLSEDVSWGPEISAYVEPNPPGVSVPALMIDVPNQLEGRENEVIAMLHKWFEEEQSA